MEAITKRQYEHGFTLIELLIVIAIIGVLSTVGIPAFKRMVAKSKQAEAKVNLGAIYTVETGFYSEYNAYGNNLTGMGYAAEGSVFHYMTGFPSSTSVVPSQGTTPGANINTVFPAYYSGPVTFTVGRPFVAGFDLEPSQIQDPGQSFLATSTGCISPGCVSSSALTNSTGFDCGVGIRACQDAWWINERRNLQNVSYGVY